MARAAAAADPIAAVTATATVAAVPATDAAVAAAADAVPTPSLPVAKAEARSTTMDHVNVDELRSEALRQLSEAVRERGGDPATTSSAMATMHGSAVRVAIERAADGSPTVHITAAIFTEFVRAFDSFLKRVGPRSSLSDGSRRHHGRSHVGIGQSQVRQSECNAHR